MTDEEKRKLMEESRQVAWAAAASRHEDIKRIVHEGPREEDANLIACLMALVLGEMEYRIIDTSEGM